MLALTRFTVGGQFHLHLSVNNVQTVQNRRPWAHTRPSPVSLLAESSLFLFLHFLHFLLQSRL